MTFAALSEALAGAVAAAAPRIVAVHARGHRHSSGLVWRTGLIVTAEEALEGDEDIRVTHADGTTVSAELVGRDPSTDVALLRADTAEAADWPAGPTPSVGSLALLVGRGPSSPLATLALVRETGGPWVSQCGGRIDGLVSLGTMMSPRLEGGAALAADGTLLGLAVAGPRRRALVIPTSTVARAVEALSSRGYVPRGYLGLSLHPLGRGEVTGAVVVGVEAGSPASTAGFLVGDIVTTWDGEPIRTVRDVARRLGPDAVGRSATVGILRAGSNADVAVTIGERPPR